MVNACNTQGDIVNASSAVTTVEDDVKKDELIIKVGTSTDERPSEESDSDDGSVSSVNSESWQNTELCRERLSRASQMIEDGIDVKQVIKTMFPDFRMNIDNLNIDSLFRLLQSLADTPMKRDKLPEFSTLEDAIELFRTKKNILVLTGAGVSVSCGIPDFRSKDGIYARVRSEYPNLPDPTAMFDISYFHREPEAFYSFAKDIFPGQFTPSISHRFIKTLESSGKLLRNYTQNIDTLEHQTGITKVVECHGSFSKATCLNCKTKFDGDIIKEEVMNMKVARCKKCIHGIIKPDIVFFGENLSPDFHRQMAVDKHDVDLVVVIGSSLKVRPVSLIPHSVDQKVPQILINRETLSSFYPDIELLGNCDDIIREICLALGGDFEKMVEDYDKEVKKDDSRRKRRHVEMTEFRQMMEKEVNDAEEEENDEPEVKKPKLARFYQRRFVNVASHMPENSYVKTDLRTTVFPGAEVFYDLETMSVHRPEVLHPELDDSLDDMDDQTSDVSSISMKSCSALPDTNPGMEVDIGSDSCHANMMFDCSEVISSKDFKDFARSILDDSQDVGEQLEVE